MGIILNKINGIFNDSRHKEYYADTRSEVAGLPANCANGSEALCLEDGSLWIKNSAGSWVEVVSGLAEEAGSEE